MVEQAAVKDLRAAMQSEVLGPADPGYDQEGAGSLPQAYGALPEPSRRAVREEVHARLAAFESGKRLAMPLEMLIGAGRA